MRSYSKFWTKDKYDVSQIPSEANPDMWGPELQQ